MKIYFAGPLFTSAQIMWNEEMAMVLRDNGYEVFLPQEDNKNCIKDDGSLDAEKVFENDVDGIKWSDLVVAVMDGEDADSGTCWECGYAFAIGKPIILIKTDLRQHGDECGMNLMLTRSATHILICDPNKSVEFLCSKLILIIKSLG